MRHFVCEGDRAFSVGADIKNAPKEMWQGVPGVGVVTNKPIIAAVQGFCVGGAYIWCKCVTWLSLPITQGFGTLRRK